MKNRFYLSYGQSIVPGLLICVSLTTLHLFSTTTLVGQESSLNAPTFETKDPGKAYESAPTTYREYKKDIVAFSRQAVDSQDHDTRLNAILDLCLLYYNIRTDVRYPTSETLQGYTNRIHYRLKETRKAIEKELKRNGQTAKQNEFLQNVSQVSAEPLNDDDLLAASTGLSDQMTLMSQANGGPQHVVEYAGGYFGGIMESNANDLIDLIENMIHPDSWENAGGVGNMRYWSQSMVLVIRATTEVHEDIERFLNMLR